MRAAVRNARRVLMLLLRLITYVDFRNASPPIRNKHRRLIILRRCNFSSEDRAAGPFALRQLAKRREDPRDVLRDRCAPPRRYTFVPQLKLKFDLIKLISSRKPGRHAKREIRLSRGIPFHVSLVAHYSHACMPDRANEG